MDLDPNLLINSGYFFDTVAFSGKHDSSLMGVSMGDYESAAVAYQLIGSLHEIGLINKNDIKIIGETDEIPQPCFIIRADLPQDLKDAILEFYLQFDDSEYFEALYGNPEIRFIQSYHEDYKIIYDMVRILDLEVG